MGVAIGDYDNDGRADLYVTNHGANILYRNEGNGRFADVTARAGVAGGGWSTSAGFFDYDNDGRLDLFVCRYLDWSFAAGHLLRRAAALATASTAIRGTSPRPPTSLFRNRGDGTFEDVSERAGIAALAGKSLGVAFADYDGDGWTDVYVANDSVPGFLLRNDGRGRFTDVALAAGAAVNGEGAAVAGMGVDFADYDGDGKVDLFVSTLSGETYSLYRNLRGQLRLHDAGCGRRRAVSFPSRAGARACSTYDNDGGKDLFVAQGHVLDTVELTSDHLRYEQPPLLLRGEQGRFVPVSVSAAVRGATRRARRGVRRPGQRRRHGRRGRPTAASVRRCCAMTPARRTNGLGCGSIGTRSNADGLGARVEATTPDGRTQHHIVTTSSSYQSASDKRVLIGLGAADRVARLTVRWPSGRTQALADLPAGQFVTVREP